MALWGHRGGRKHHLPPLEGAENATSPPWRGHKTPRASPFFVGRAPLSREEKALAISLLGIRQFDSPTVPTVRQSDSSDSSDSCPTVNDSKH